jgi:hypothetical protein
MRQKDITTYLSASQLQIFTRVIMLKRLFNTRGRNNFMNKFF